MSGEIADCNQLNIPHINKEDSVDPLPVKPQFKATEKT